MRREDLTRAIIDYVAEYPDTRTSWRAPLVGFVSANDPLFESLHEVVSPTHALPVELLAGARSVIVYFLPFDPAIPRSNRHKKELASVEWARAYFETNRLIVDLNAHLGSLLEAAGNRVALLPPTHNFDRETLKSDWSHKHVAFIAGLGSFGTNHLLLTERGCAGRLGSLISDLDLEATPRAEHERCLAKAGHVCHACVKRCPVGALESDEFDRAACYQRLLENEAFHHEIGKADVCGKCASGVPCSIEDPVRKVAARAATFPA